MGSDFYLQHSSQFSPFNCSCCASADSRELPLMGTDSCLACAGSSCHTTWPARTGQEYIVLPFDKWCCWHRSSCMRSRANNGSIYCSYPTCILPKEAEVQLQVSSLRGGLGMRDATRAAGTAISKIGLCLCGRNGQRVHHPHCR